LNSYTLLKSFKVPDGNSSIFGFEELFLDKNNLFSNPKGIILFVHGFNSSASIWGNEKEGFIAAALNNNYIPFAIDFSDPLHGSIVNFADIELVNLFNFSQLYIREKIQQNRAIPIHFVAHSMGGIILRYFLSSSYSHPNHSIDDLKSSSITSAALLSVPNHGISKVNSDNLVSKMEKLISDFNSFVGKKHGIQLANKAFFQLLSGNSIISTLLQNLPLNMWPTLFWMNFIAERDIVVEHKSSYFSEKEVSYLRNNFKQVEFDATHMKNPFYSFTNKIQGKIQEKITFNDNGLIAKFEKKFPDFGFITKDPIYANDMLIKLYFDLLDSNIIKQLN
jgi:hypothetical protein